MELHTSVFGVNRPPSESLEDRGKLIKLESESLEDRGKLIKLESESESESELVSETESDSDSETEPGSKPKPRVIYDWELKRPEDLVASDFSMYEDDPKPFTMCSGRFEYKNKAWIEREKKIEVAMADYRERSRNLSIFDAIAPPKIAGLCGGVIPLPIDDDCRLNVTPLCNAALDNYNNENQGSNFVLADILRTTWRAGGMYYITFQATHPSNSNATTFQAEVQRKPKGEHKVYSCAIKT
ncbi:uncharacterized protein LOC131642729 isoform X1 [Vicia villosa]|uniref:uncharacterized protein LOC131642729 isoform X1 n=1 Tax=Vicia villosa TaxID=3911 RepID=UPI00273C0295|nr:uncharacterized protein LOC131642729 isoform X1 [Vicia villosa]